MTDTITFAAGLRDGAPILMAKQITVEGGLITNVEAAPQTALFAYREAQIQDLTSLMRAVWRAAQAGEIAVRGRPLAPTGRRAIYEGEHGEPPGLEVTPRLWVAFDWDGIPLEEGMPPELAEDPAEHPDPLTMPEHGVRRALLRLPPAFRDVVCGWQISASAGYKPGFRLRTWHWLDHPTTGVEIKAWCQPAIKRALLDPVTLVEAQPHYLAVRTRGGTDPCPQRFGILQAPVTEVPVPDIGAIIRAQESRERAARAPRQPRNWRDPADHDTAYAQSRIEQCIEAVRTAPDGTKHTTYKQEVARAAALCKRHRVAWPPVRDALQDTYEATLPATEARRRRRSSTEGVIRWVEAREGSS